MSDASEALRAFLLRTPFFGGLEEPGLDKLVDMAIERRFADGQVVFHEGEAGRSMYVIIRGAVELTQCARSGREVVLASLGRGDFFGETTLIEMQPRPATARARGDTCLFELTNMDLYRLYKTDLKAYVIVLQNINRELCRRIRLSDRRMTQATDAGPIEARPDPQPGSTD